LRHPDLPEALHPEPSPAPQVLRVQPAPKEEKVKKDFAAICLTTFFLLCALLIRMPPESLSVIGGLALGGALGLTGYLGFVIALSVLERR
jgi:hypothetical protein